MYILNINLFVFHTAFLRKFSNEISGSQKAENYIQVCQAQSWIFTHPPDRNGNESAKSDYLW